VPLINGGCDCPVKPRSAFEVSHRKAVGHRGLKRRDVKHHYPWSIICEKNQKVGLSGNHINIVRR
jgi:hypothetical protein